jgi:hypothetical protein
MSLLDRVKERTGSDLSDAELQAMIDGITAELDARLGPAGPITVEIGDLADPITRENRSLRLLRPVDQAQPITVTEFWLGNTELNYNQLQITDADYAILHGGRTLQRLIGGPNGRMYWSPLVKVAYTPVGDQALRDEATIKIVALDLSYRGGLKSERAGDYQFTLSGDAAADRQAIIDGLVPRVGMLMA